MRVTPSVSITGIAAVLALGGCGLHSTSSLEGRGARPAMAAVADPPSDGPTQEKAGLPSMETVGSTSSLAPAAGPAYGSTIRRSS